MSVLSLCGRSQSTGDDNLSDRACSSLCSRLATRCTTALTRSISPVSGLYCAEAITQTYLGLASYQKLSYSSGHLPGDLSVWYGTAPVFSAVQTVCVSWMWFGMGAATEGSS